MYDSINTLSLVEAAALLAEKTGKPFFKDTTLRLIRAGSEGRIPVYWRNSLQKFSALFGFSGEVKRSSRADRLMRVNHTDLRRLEINEQITTLLFEPTEEDWQMLDAVDSEDGFRSIIEDCDVTVSRDQLLVFEEDVYVLARRAKSIDLPEKSIKAQENCLESGFVKSELLTTKNASDCIDSNEWNIKAIDRGWKIIEESSGRCFPTQKELAIQIKREFKQAMPPILNKHGHPLDASTIERELKRHYVSCKHARTKSNLNKKGN